MHKFARSSITYRSDIPLKRIPVFAFAAAGEPLVSDSLERVGYVYIRDDYYRASYICVRIKGNSMDDGDFHSLRDGEHVIIDKNDRDPRHGKIYLWRHPSVGPCLKQYAEVEGQPFLLSFNPDHKPFQPEPGSKPFGRYVGVLHVGTGIIEAR